MSFEFVKKLQTENELKEKIRLDIGLAEKVREKRKQIEEVFTDASDRFILVIGPCSADNPQAVLEYCRKLADLQERYEKILIIPRVYTNKPRTNGDGYKGLAHQPDRSSSPDLIAGLEAIRKLHMVVLRETGFVTADEMLYPQNHLYLDDILGYVAVGARSTENQWHRFVASGLDIPVGMKNPTSGDLSVLANSVYAAQKPQTFGYWGWQVNTKGNPLAHGILRGGLIGSRYHPNFMAECVSDVLDNCLTENPKVIIDTNHANSAKNHNMQPHIAEYVMRYRKENPALKRAVIGLMVESYLKDGAHKKGESYEFGKSVTDKCIGWDKTVEMVDSISRYL